MAEGFASIGDVIPSVFYDLIARIVPGAAVVTIAAYFNVDTFHPNIERAEQIALILGSGYIVGFILSAISTGILWLLTKPTWFSDYSDEYFWSKIKEHKNDSELSALLAKMVAESTCCENLFVAVFALAFLDPDRLKHRVIYLAAALITLYVAYIRREILKRRLQNP